MAAQSAAICLELLDRHAGVGGADDLLPVLLGERRHRLLVAGEDRLVGRGRRPVRMIRGQRLDAVDGEDRLAIDRMLDPEVPSWSKVAMRSAIGTKPSLPSSVAAARKSRIAVRAAPSFQEGSASSWAAIAAGAPRRAAIPAAAAATTPPRTVRRPTSRSPAGPASRGASRSANSMLLSNDACTDRSHQETEPRRAGRHEAAPCPSRTHTDPVRFLLPGFCSDHGT